MISNPAASPCTDASVEVAFVAFGVSPVTGCFKQKQSRARLSTNIPGADSYPINSFTWIYLRTPGSDSTRAAALSGLLDWIYCDGQRSAVQEGYSALPPQLLAVVRKKAKALE